VARGSWASPSTGRRRRGRGGNAQEDHRERGGREGVIADYVDRQVPEEWQKWDLQQRLMWLGSGAHGGETLVDRDRICALEVWCECLKGISSI
jgi:hypothetical protein